MAHWNAPVNFAFIIPKTGLSHFSSPSSVSSCPIQILGWPIHAFSLYQGHQLNHFLYSWLIGNSNLGPQAQTRVLQEARVLCSSNFPWVHITDLLWRPGRGKGEKKREGSTLRVLTSFNQSYRQENFHTWTWEVITENILVERLRRKKKVHFLYPSFPWLCGKMLPQVNDGKYLKWTQC